MNRKAYTNAQLEGTMTLNSRSKAENTPQDWETNPPPLFSTPVT